MNRLLALMAVLGFAASSQQLFAQKQGDPKLTELWEPKVPVVVPGNTAADPPSDAIVLFDGKSLAAWEGDNGKAPEWTIADNAVTVKPGSGGITTKQSFGDMQLHIEWRSPAVVKGEGQDRGNSGIFLMNRYEIQVLDSYENETYSNGQAASVYKQRIPLANACRPPGEWQTYDIIFTAPRFHPDGRLQTAGRVTVIHNGVLVQNNVEIWGNTNNIGVADYKMHSLEEPLFLQDHQELVSYRNIWVRRL